MTRRLVLADRRTRRPGRSATATRGPRYRGALSCRTSFVSTAILYCTRSGTRSQCSACRQRSGDVVVRSQVGGRLVVPPHWAPTAIGALGRLGFRAILHYGSRVASALVLLRVSAMDSGMWLLAPLDGSGAIGGEKRSTATLRFTCACIYTAGLRRCRLCRDYRRTAPGLLGRQGSVS